MAGPEPRPAVHRRRPEAGAAPHHLFDERAGPECRVQAEEVRAQISDVIGKYHPHGDSACYEALVLMAQPFSYRYPLIEGQGRLRLQRRPEVVRGDAPPNQDPDRRSAVGELGQGTTDWAPNFDGTPGTDLDAGAAPHLLLNGTTGIAVGMATDVPPHISTRSSARCCTCWTTPTPPCATCANTCRAHLPSSAEIITAANDLRNIYETGNGSVRARATFTKKPATSITALPFQVSPSKSRSPRRCAQAAVAGGHP